MDGNKPTYWALSQFYTDETRDNFVWPVVAAYCNGHVAPRHPDTPDGWALVLCPSLHVECATEDPRVQPYRTVWDTITPETVTAYAAQGATAGMMLCQLLSLLAQWEPAFHGLMS